jgi:hypothetical protein
MSNFAASFPYVLAKALFFCSSIRNSYSASSFSSSKGFFIAGTRNSISFRILYLCTAFYMATTLNVLPTTAHLVLSCMMIMKINTYAHVSNGFEESQVALLNQK